MQNSGNIRKLIINKGYSDINPVEFGTEVCKASQAWGPVAKEWYVLHFVVSGKGKFKTERGEYSISENELFVIKPGEITYYEADKDEPWEYLWLSFYSNIRLPKTIEENDVIKAPHLKKCFIEAAEQPDLLENTRGYEEFLLSKIWELISLIKMREKRPPSQGSYVKRALSIMRSEFQTGITAGQIAERLSLNRSYFTKIFTDATKKSPGKYLHEFRMNKAAQMLRTKTYTVSVVASSVGFFDVFSFSRAFKAHFGISPGKYQNEYSELKPKDEALKTHEKM